MTSYSLPDLRRVDFRTTYLPSNPDELSWADLERGFYLDRLDTNAVGWEASLGVARDSLSISDLKIIYGFELESIKYSMAEFEKLFATYYTNKNPSVYSQFSTADHWMDSGISAYTPDD